MSARTPRPCCIRSSTPQAGRNGRLSIQTDPRLFRDTEAIVDQAVRFSAAGAQHDRQDPGDPAGIPAIEEATYRGVSINATVSFTLPQCVAVAEAVERGLSGASEGKDDRHDEPGVHDHGGPPGRLAEGGGRQGRHHYRPRLPGVGGRGGVQKDLPHSSASAATGSGCCRPLSATTCTGASSSAGTSSSRPPTPGRCVSMPAISLWCPGSTTRRPRSGRALDRQFADFRRAYKRGRPLGRPSSTPSAYPADAAPVHRRHAPTWTPWSATSWSLTRTRPRTGGGKPDMSRDKTMASSRAKA